MPYDDAQWQVRHIIGPIFATCASAGIKFTASATVKTGTLADSADQIEFFKNIKLTGIKAVTRATQLLTGALSDHSMQVVVTEGTNACATCALGTAAGLTTSGGVSSTYQNIDSTETLSLFFKGTGDGTAGTMGQMSADVYLEYQNRMP